MVNEVDCVVFELFVCFVLEVEEKCVHVELVLCVII